MGIKFCKELSNEEIYEYNKEYRKNTKITQNNDKELCFYKFPKTFANNYRRSINIFYIDFDINDSIPKIVDYLYEYMYFNNLDEKKNVLVKLFVKWNNITPSNSILKKCDTISENIVSYIQIPCIVINIFGNNDLLSKVCAHMVNDEFHYRIQKGIVITNDEELFYEKVPQNYGIINLKELYRLNLKQQENFNIQYPYNRSPYLSFKKSPKTEKYILPNEI
jgi:hypothetical protein